ncbi:cupin domain-containing protein [Modestobacter altitudinis]|uniref:cupin domain-containing protein n=1 Tax=Modestobacter altitudinis TaxID=2213158 RepID=UPI00110C8DF2|nr:cupin domain-containing protein [Modestobacter altitudinis]
MAGPDSVPPRTRTVVQEAAPVLRAGDDLAARLTRTEVQRGPSSVPGREIVQVLTEIPRGVESGWHTHPGEEVGYLIGGTVELCVEGRPTRTVRAGEGFLIPPRTPHNARDLGPGTGRMLSTYLVEVGQPLATLTAGGVVPARRAGRAASG